MSVNPFAARSGIGGLIQRQFGGAWPKIQAVHDHLTQIEHLSDNIAVVREAANNLSRGILTIEEMASGPGTTTFVEWPAALDINDLLYYTVLIVDTNGAIYTEASGYFDTLIQGGALEVAIDVSAPDAVNGGIVRWTIDYKN